MILDSLDENQTFLNLKIYKNVFENTFLWVYQDQINDQLKQWTDLAAMLFDNSYLKNEKMENSIIFSKSIS